MALWVASPSSVCAWGGGGGQARPETTGEALALCVGKVGPGGGRVWGNLIW